MVAPITTRPGGGGGGAGFILFLHLPVLVSADTGGTDEDQILNRAEAPVSGLPSPLWILFFHFRVAPSAERDVEDETAQRRRSFPFPVPLYRSP